MKKHLITALLLFTAGQLPLRSSAQSLELQQLLLDIQKLSSMKSTLSEMQSAYSVIANGYEQVKGITQGNFSLHQVFIDGLLLVNPNIKSYAKVADIIADEALILKEYKSAFGNFKSSGLFNPKEIDYMGNVYANLFNQTLENLNELTLVLTESTLRMSDDERLKNIDRIYTDTEDKLAFLRSFNRKANNVLVQRSNLQEQSNTLKNLYGQ